MIVFNEFTVLKDVIPVVDISVAHAANDVIYGPVALQNVSKDANWPVYLKKVNVIDKSYQNAALRLVFFDAQPSGTFTGNAAFAPSDADMAHYIGHVDIAAGVVNGTVNSMQTTIPAQPVPFAPVNGRNIWMVIVTTGTPTYVGTSDLLIRLQFTRP